MHPGLCAPSGAHPHRFAAGGYILHVEILPVGFPLLLFRRYCIVRLNERVEAAAVYLVAAFGQRVRR